MKSLYPRKKHSKATKVCAVCEKKKGIMHFPIIKRTLAGDHLHHSYCKPCLNQYMTDRYHYLKATK